MLEKSANHKCLSRDVDLLIYLYMYIVESSSVERSWQLWWRGDRDGMGLGGGEVMGVRGGGGLNEGPQHTPCLKIYSPFSSIPFKPARPYVCIYPHLPIEMPFLRIKMGGKETNARTGKGQELGE